MATRRAENGWAVRCEGCERVGEMVGTSSAREALSEAGKQGWARPRPGVSDYCPVCMDGRC